MPRRLIIGRTAVKRMRGKKTKQECVCICDSIVAQPSACGFFFKMANLSEKFHIVVRKKNYWTAVDLLTHKAAIVKVYSKLASFHIALW